MPLLNYLLLHRKLGVSRGDLVLEVGPGGSPFLRSDVLVEKYIEDSKERPSVLTLDRAIISADGSALPFRDKSAGFIFCAHVLEHVPEPTTFLRELSRVGKRGLIICPHGGYERLDPRRSHLWYVWNENGSLRLKQKRSWNEFPEVQKYFKNIAELPSYWRFWGKHRRLFETALLWENSISYRVEQEQQLDLSGFTKASINPPSGCDEAACEPRKPRAKRWIAKIVRPLVSAHWNVDLNSVICCPLCGGNLSSLTARSKRIDCKRCGAAFPVRRSIARLLKDEAWFPGEKTTPKTFG